MTHKMEAAVDAYIPEDVNAEELFRFVPDKESGVLLLESKDWKICETVPFHYPVKRIRIWIEELD